MQSTRSTLRALSATVVLLFFLLVLTLAGPGIALTQTQQGGATPQASITLGQTNVENGLFLVEGGDADTKVVQVGQPPVEARETGNGQALPATDGNTIPDYYMQFRIDHAVIFQGKPTTKVRIDIEYFDQGTDTFAVQYDAASGGPFGDGRFKVAGSVGKTDTKSFKTASFVLDDAYFGQRDNGADFRIDDRGDGAEIIHQVSLTLNPAPPAPRTINVDSCGANPWDTNPDSSAIQACIDQAASGDTVTFTSGVGSPGYKGYLIDKTVFLNLTSAKHNVTFTSTDPNNPALLQADPSLKGFVMRLYARPYISNPGDIDDIVVSHLVLDGGFGQRIALGPDGIDDGIDDNWGSWLPNECQGPGDPWCSPGTLSMEGAFDPRDPFQNYQAHPSRWSTGLVVDSVIIQNTVDGTALFLEGAASTVKNSTIKVAGYHNHAPGCPVLNPREMVGAWAMGIDFLGPDMTVTGNLVQDASDVGIGTFGGKNTVISNNQVVATKGYHGMFAGIQVAEEWFGDSSGSQIVGNRVVNEGDSTCGGIHVGITISDAEWQGACYQYGYPSAVGNVGSCVADPSPPKGSFCKEGAPCQEWVHVDPGATFTLKDNFVSGAEVNYVIESFDNQGTLVEQNNTSDPPRQTDWEAAKNGCTFQGVFDIWGPLDRVAHDPSLPGWTDQRIYCVR
jgi:hypothetical protein